ncbi:MAG: T9SS type A sorting domain-containing protein [Crocinitomicaceae bacterium]|nr:T9SS type A sorting domain-containing protein [Flavobacteriales bacterium]NQZ37142.1 T9SS type A sorting domain-containing protein [Crocinitomicaceae bacterium]
MKKFITLIVLAFSLQGLYAQNALNFPDNTDYGTVPNDPLLEFTQSFTIEAWVKLSGSGYQTVIATDSLNGTGHTGYWFGVTPSGAAGIQLFHNSFSWTTITGTTNVNDGTWHHIAVTSNQTIINIVVDGVLDGAGAYTAPAYNGHALDFGVDQEGNFITGTIDDVRLWWRSVPVAEINTYKDSCLTGMEDSLVALYKFDETAGSTFADAGLYGLNGTLTNMTDSDWVTGVVCQPTTPLILSALHFDAIDDHVKIDTVQDAVLDFTGDFTIEAWIKAEVGGLWPTVVSKFDNVGGSRYGFWFGITGSGTVGMQVFDGTAGTWPTAAGTTYLQDNMWHHIACVNESNTLKVYVDGVLEGSVTATTPVFNDHAMWFGNDAENDIFFGSMDRVRIWNTSRTDAEILANKGVCLNGQETDLLGLYTMNEGTGSVVGNSVGTGLTGSLVNMDPATDWVEGTTCESTSTASIDVLSSEDVSAYPNPTEGKVSLDLGGLNDVSIRVYSMDGQLVYSEANITTEEHTFNLEGEAGIYHVIITTENVRKHLKLIRL